MHYDFDSDYKAGIVEGYETGYAAGCADTVYKYEQRMSAIWTELQTLNARIDYLEKHTGLGQND